MIMPRSTRRAAAQGHAAETANDVLVVIDAEELRASGIRISRRLSWEKTVEDLTTQFFHGKHLPDNLKPLAKAMHVLVRFGYEGAIYRHKKAVDPSSAPAAQINDSVDGTVQNGSASSGNTSPTGSPQYTPSSSRESSPLPEKGTENDEYLFFFEPTQIEGDFSRSLPKESKEDYEWKLKDLFVAGLTASLAKESPKSIKHLSGYQKSKKSAEEKQIEEPAAVPKIGFVEGPKYKVAEASQWSIFTDLLDKHKFDAKNKKPAVDEARGEGDGTPNPEGTERKPTPDGWEIAKKAANDIAQNGLKGLLSQVPTVSYGKLTTADRHEAESYRAIAGLVEGYLGVEKQKKPISISVFGPPGAAKSFGVKELVKPIGEALGRKVTELTFNLSQFMDYADLLAAFHKIRDTVLNGEIPLAFFDEFDTAFGEQKLGWLRYFLAPMQDGEFLENGQDRPIGKGIFVFAGGTCATYEEFVGNFYDGDSTRAKKPDFVSRLRGYINILGPNSLNYDPAQKTHIPEDISAHEISISGTLNIPCDNNVDPWRTLQIPPLNIPQFTISRLDSGKPTIQSLSIPGFTIAKRGENASIETNITVAEQNMGNLSINIVKREHRRDTMYPVRRAIPLHSLLSRLPGKKDPTVQTELLNGLLTVPGYKFGTRSLESILAMSTWTKSNNITMSDLPSTLQLEMHVDVEALEGQMDPKSVIGRNPSEVTPQPIDESLDMLYRLTDQVPRLVFGDVDKLLAGFWGS
ncbi:hypothetical protein AWENTII_009794 [Aspergillus wentii]